MKKAKPNNLRDLITIQVDELCERLPGDLRLLDFLDDTTDAFERLQELADGIPAIETVAYSWGYLNGIADAHGMSVRALLREHKITVRQKGDLT